MLDRYCIEHSWTVLAIILPCEVAVENRAAQASQKNPLQTEHYYEKPEEFAADRTLLWTFQRDSSGYQRDSSGYNIIIACWMDIALSILEQCCQSSWHSKQLLRIGQHKYPEETAADETLLWTFQRDSNGYSIIIACWMDIAWIILEQCWQSSWQSSQLLKIGQHKQPRGVRYRRDTATNISVW